MSAVQQQNQHTNILYIGTNPKYVNASLPNKLCNMQRDLARDVEAITDKVSKFIFKCVVLKLIPETYFVKEPHSDYYQACKMPRFGEMQCWESYVNVNKNENSSLGSSSAADKIELDERSNFNSDVTKMVAFFDNDQAIAIFRMYALSEKGEYFRTPDHRVFCSRRQFNSMFEEEFSKINGQQYLEIYKN